jgi:hypothetical protein
LEAGRRQAGGIQLLVRPVSEGGNTVAPPALDAIERVVRFIEDLTPVEQSPVAGGDAADATAEC